MHVLRTPKKREALPDVLDRAELPPLLDVPGKKGVWKRLKAGKVERDRLLLALFSYGGLRRSELLGLDVDDVDLDRRLIRVRNAKGGRQRVVPIHPGLVPLSSHISQCARHQATRRCSSACTAGVRRYATAGPA